MPIDMLDWSTGVYNPRVDITKDTTTLYASDRDVFLFLVDDLNPIEAGRLADSTIYEMEQRGEFPLRFALSPRCIVWDLAEIEAWLQARRAAPIRRAQHPDVAKRKTRPIKVRDQAPSKA